MTDSFDDDSFLRAAAAVPRFDDVVVEGTVVAGHHRVLERIGRGGMGVVYRARDTVLERDVALKVLPPSSAGDAAARARLLREARLAAALSHPNIVTIHEAGLDGERVYLTMELLRGRTLRDVLSRGRIDRDEALRVARGIAEAIAHAHAHGVIHRDLKPENVIVDARSVTVLDFGLARAGEASLTATGVHGTPGYMAPEQLEGRALDGACDVFAFGAILYELLSGRRAFAGDTAVDALVANARQSPPRLRGPHADLVERCLSRDSRARPSMAQALDALSARASRAPYLALALLPLLALPWVWPRHPAPASSGAPFSSAPTPTPSAVTSSPPPLALSVTVSMSSPPKPRPPPAPVSTSVPSIAPKTAKGRACVRSAECASGFCVAERCL